MKNILSLINLLTNYKNYKSVSYNGEIINGLLL